MNVFSRRNCEPRANKTVYHVGIKPKGREDSVSAAVSPGVGKQSEGAGFFAGHTVAPSRHDLRGQFHREGGDWQAQNVRAVFGRTSAGRATGSTQSGRRSEKAPPIRGRGKSFSRGNGVLG